ncbi:protein-tyrosine phosphatase [Sinobaca qinghaiensis]|uniref:Tyrosine-protein phosphatase n=1 Tax=Sinobaca qinghaiensis TaxID=342944 RepID=A0A419V564_9BACL|nr:CpsB/CapC family capsule biosynthesis tyrosine phosphatase [Sinobaca qinghaiensis]RKD73635.1 protein-tyrosine phosphatase [Sinobaca qinghaiensis]
MIDLHTHILHGIDDGPKTMEDSVALARSAVEAGVESIVATPHHRNGMFTNSGDMIRSKVQELNDLLEYEEVPLEVKPGQEIRINGDILDELKKGTALTLNDSRYLLIELSSVEVPSYLKRLFYDLQVAGYIPLIAHPERNKTFVSEPGKLFDIVTNGAITQITAEALSGKGGKASQQFCETLIEHNLAHIISSDAHGVDHRPFALAEAYAHIDDVFGPEVSNMFKENAAAIFDDQPVGLDQPEPFEKKKKKKRFGIF